MEETLKSFLKLIKELPSRQEFVKAFGAVTERHKRFEQTTAKDLGEFKTKLNDKVETHISLSKEVVFQHIEDSKGQIKTALKGHKDTIDAKLASIRDGIDGDKGEKGEPGNDGANGRDGKDAEPVDTDELISTILEQLPAPKVDKKGKQIPGWGAHPLTILNSSGTVDKVARFIKFTGATVTRSADGVTTIAITSSGGGFQVPLTGGLTGTNTWAIAPNVIVVDGVPKQKVNTDGTVNWTGTTTTVLSVQPNYDVYATS